MTIKIYPGQLPGRPIEEHPWVGTIGAWFDAVGIDYAAHEVQPVTVEVNGDAVPVELWRTLEVTNADEVSIRPIPRGGTLLIAALVAVAAVAAVMLLMPKPKAGASTPQGKGLQTAQATANQARRNAVVPELLGRHKRYPDYLVAPRRFFADPRTQYLDLMLCVGPGRYDIERACIGNTLISDIEGAQYAIHQPGESLAGVEQRLSWYGAPEVGGTSGGSAGLELSAVADSALAPAAGSYLLSGNQISIPALDPATFPVAWGVGTIMSLLFAQDVTVATQTEGVGEGIVSFNTFEGNFSEIAPSVGMLLRASGVGSDSVQVMSVSGNKITLGKWVSDGEGGSYQRISGLANGVRRIGLSRAARTYTVASIGDRSITVTASDSASGAGVFVARTVTAAEASFSVQSDTVYGEIAGPFAASPQAETCTAIEVDMFFPQGLCRLSDSGDVQERTVGVEIGWRTAGAGVWNSQVHWYTQATMDQIGFTHRIDVPPGRYEVRIRRRGAKSTSTQVNDAVQWYGLRSLLTSPASYPWTTMSVRIKGLGQIAGNSENQVSVVATRRLPTLQTGGAWSAAQATRDLSAAVRHIAHSVGYTDANLDMDELRRLHAIWQARGETLDHVFDETTVKAALDLCLLAGMSDMTLEDGKIRPVREGLRTEYEALFSAQNTKEGVRMTFTAPAPDDNDGAEVEFVNAASGWVPDTIECVLPGSAGVKLQKIKLDGVTDKTRAWRIGMRQAAELRYRRWQYSCSTELDALPCGYGAHVGMVAEVPGFSQSAILTHITGNAPQAVLTVSEPLQWGDGAHVIGIRRPDGSLAGPYPATRGADDYTALAAGIQPADWPEVTLQREPPHIAFGPSTQWTLPALVRSIKADGMQSAQLQAVNYDPRIYANDDNNPPA